MVPHWMTHPEDDSTTNITSERRGDGEGKMSPRKWLSNKRLVQARIVGQDSEVAALHWELETLF